MTSNMFTGSAATCLALVCGFSMAAQSAPTQPSSAPACGVDETGFKMKRGGPISSPDKIPPGKALIYVIELMPEVGLITSHVKVGVDGQWVSQLSSQTFTTLLIEPGIHHFCAQYEGKAVPSEIGAAVLRRLEVEPGKVYYLLYRGFVCRDSGEIGFLDLVDEDEGRYALSRSVHITLAAISK